MAVFTTAQQRDEAGRRVSWARVADGTREIGRKADRDSHSVEGSKDSRKSTSGVGTNDTVWHHRLLQLLLGTELRRVAALSLAAVGRARREAGVALAADLLVAPVAREPIHFGGGAAPLFRSTSKILSSTTYLVVSDAHVCQVRLLRRGPGVRGRQMRWTTYS
ncbi:uncharacterized protein PSFLO_02278 [Pseudozyma flocculosa]|uniref:Uncharacterized protein n=1 Tax=Pseudozyma flocculosa TaxID=84751 RepID=A0A5C3EZF9_9BASI|nr:uncharacterized protein PSFLO_02278 [Pseudozyma flocculosa]